MDERVIQFRVGVVVVAAAAITIILIMLIGAGPRLWFEQYTIYVGFPQAPGVTVDTPVRKSGVLIGRVSGVQLLDEGGVVLTLKIDEQFVLRHNEVCQIGSGSLVTGDAVLEFVPSGDPNAPRDPIEDGEYLANGVLAADPLQVFAGLEDDLNSAIGSVEAAGNEVAMMARNFNTMIGNNQDQLRRIMQKSEQTIDQFQLTLVHIDELVNDPELEQALKQALRDVPELVNEARATLEQARGTFEQFQQVGERAEQNLANLEGLTRPLGERGEQLAQTLDETTRNLNSLIGELASFADAVNNREGTLGKLVYDDEVYDDIRETIENVSDASSRLRPILENARILTDKLATDPRQLGVKGALDRRPLGVGLKYDISGQHQQQHQQHRRFLR